MATSLKRKVLTSRTWRKFEQEAGSVGLLAYLDCSEDMIYKLKEITNESQSCKELKENLLLFVADREKFHAHINNNHKHEEPEFRCDS